MNDAINQLLWQKLCGTFVHYEETSIINNGRHLGCVNQTYNIEMDPSNDQNWQMVSNKKESKISTTKNPLSMWHQTLLVDISCCYFHCKIWLNAKYDFHIKKNKFSLYFHIKKLNSVY